MNIQITGLPEKQKIKSINFNIVFDDSNVDTNTTVIIEPELKKTTVKDSKTEEIEVIKPTAYNDNLEPIEPIMPSIDISKREPKIDPNMLEETF